MAEIRQELLDELLADYESREDLTGGSIVCDSLSVALAAVPSREALV